MRDHFVLMATYNAWMNTKLYATAGELSTERLFEDKGASFGSVFGTLNHIVVADRIWLKRFAEHPAGPGALEWVPYASSKGVVAERFSSLVLHFFNQQTHHRGQATSLLSQFGEDVGITDLLALIPNE